jgi:hypothetical protein
MWGPIDDITPLVFRFELERQLGIVLSDEEMRGFFETSITVRGAIEAIRRIGEEKPAMWEWRQLSKYVPST